MKKDDRVDGKSESDVSGVAEHHEIEGNDWIGIGTGFDLTLEFEFEYQNKRHLVHLTIFIIKANIKAVTRRKERQIIMCGEGEIDWWMAIEFDWIGINPSVNHLMVCA